MKIIYFKFQILIWGKIHNLMFIYLNLQKDSFMNTFALILDFKQV